MVQLRKIIQKRIREQRDGVSVASDVNVAISGNVEERNVATGVSSEQSLSDEEVRRERGEELPRREAMSLIDANVAAPVNAAAALNVLSDDSTAIANAEQSSDITQSN